MKVSKKKLLIFALLVSLFTLALTNKVSAEEISGEFNAGDEISDSLLIVKNSNGSEEETLVNLTEMFALYGVNGKIAVVSEDSLDDDCIVIGDLDELIEDYGSDGKLIVSNGVEEIELGNIGNLGGTCETNGRIVITDEGDDDPYIVGICTIGQLVSLS